MFLITRTIKQGLKRIKFEPNDVEDGLDIHMFIPQKSNTGKNLVAKKSRCIGE